MNESLSILLLAKKASGRELPAKLVTDAENVNLLSSPTLWRLAGPFGVRSPQQ